jgi:hypothetical protein
MGIASALVLMVAATPLALASFPQDAAVGVGGYDLVAYHTQGAAMRGTGFHQAVHDGVTYLFTSEEHKEAFESTPETYLPAYGGYCAFGVVKNMKLPANPEVWKVVDGTLYLNVDSDIQKKWEQDIPGHIATANDIWQDIRDKRPSEL